MTSSELSINKEYDTLIEHNEHTREKNPDYRDVRRSKRQRTTKSFGDDFIVYLVDDTRRTIKEAYSSLDADYRKQYIMRWILLCQIVLGK